MQARSASKGAADSTAFVSAVLVFVAIGVGIFGASLAASVGAPKAITRGPVVMAPAAGANLSPDAAERNGKIDQARAAQVASLRLQKQAESQTAAPHRAAVRPFLRSS